MIDKNLLKSRADALNILLDQEALERFDDFAVLLTKWNEVMNLTTITEPTEIVHKHFIDCLSLMSVTEIKDSEKIIDVGTGAGFPGIPLLIARPSIALTLMDSTQKRLTFIEEVLKELSLNGEIIHSRAEDLGQNPNYREKYDLATARAVARLRNLSEYCMPFVKTGGKFISMKGAIAPDEISEAEKAIKLFGGTIAEQREINLEKIGERSFIIIKKLSQTPSKYPRVSAKMAKNPII